MIMLLCFQVLHKLSRDSPPRMPPMPLGSQLTTLYKGLREEIVVHLIYLHGMADSQLLFLDLVPKTRSCKLVLTKHLELKESNAELVSFKTTKKLPLKFVKVDIVYLSRNLSNCK